MSSKILLFMAGLAIFGKSSVAQERPFPAVSVGAGIIDAFRGDATSDFSADMRFRGKGRLQPRVIGTWSTHSSRFIGAGLLWHVSLSRRWDLAVGFAPGYYEREHGPNLGSALEFLSTLEISRELRGHRRFGIELGHISNGSFGDENPGTETLRLFWQVPLRSDWRWRRDRAD